MQFTKIICSEPAFPGPIEEEEYEQLPKQNNRLARPLVGLRLTMPRSQVDYNISVYIFRQQAQLCRQG